MKKHLAACALIVGSSGCAALNPTPPLETAVKTAFEEVIAPAVKEGMRRGVEGLQIQAGAHGVNPTYVVEFEGKWVVGIEGRATIGIEGVGGQLQISAVGHDDPEPDSLPPGIGDPE